MSTIHALTCITPLKIRNHKNEQGYVKYIQYILLSWSFKHHFEKKWIYCFKKTSFSVIDLWIWLLIVWSRVKKFFWFDRLWLFPVENSIELMKLLFLSNFASFKVKINECRTVKSEKIWTWRTEEIKVFFRQKYKKVFFWSAYKKPIMQHYFCSK